MAVHFVGFKDGDSYYRASQIWGPPDFIHPIWDRRATALGGDFDPDNDFYVFATGTEFDTPNKWIWYGSFE